VAAGPPHTLDTLFDGKVSLLQPAKGHGYRANVDAILLASFARRTGPVAALAVDLGSGAGAVALSLWHLGGAKRLVLVERDHHVAELARRNLDLNEIGARGIVHVCDLRVPLMRALPELVHAADLVIANPPFTEPSRSSACRQPPEIPRLAARHGEVAPFLRAMADALGRRGKGYLVYPARALVELVVAARASGLEPKRLQLVHGRPDRPARIALIQVAHARPGGLVVDPAVVETDECGKPSRELEVLVGRDRGEQPV
jgi:tRNA1Val (adenine37-N6)-methyltransferase